METKNRKLKDMLTLKKNEGDINFLKRIKGLEFECMLMVDYIANSRKIEPKEQLGSDLIKSFTELSVDIGMLEKNYDSSAPPDEDIKKIYNSVVETHKELSKLTLPATPVSIKYTEFSSSGHLERNQTINLLIVFTFMFLVLFLFFSFLKTQAIMGANLIEMFLILSASGLGAGFYTLITVRKYLINRTYDPRYNPTYIIRFIIGITSGTILALIFKKDLELNKSIDFSYSVEMLALVGGFAADAVTIILKRTSEVLITVFKGADNNDKEKGNG